MKIQTETKTISSCNILEVTVGTNCPQGGDAGHGGRTLFKLKNEANTSMEIKVDGKCFDLSNCGELEIILFGDSECQTFIDALKFAASALERQEGGIGADISIGEVEL